MTIIDTNHDVTSKLAKLSALGITDVIRYFNRRNPSGEKTVKPAEAKAFAKVGMKLGIVYEYNADVSTFNDATGYADAAWSLKYAPTIGMPHLAVADDLPAVYFAVDFDPTAAQIKSRIVPYFQGVARALGASPWFRVGVYGSGLVCTTLKAKGLVSLTWITQSTGFTGSRAYVAAGNEDVLQKLPKLIAGVDTDPDERGPRAKDIGTFIPVFA